MEMLNTYRVKLVRCVTENKELDVFVKTNLDINELEEKLGNYMEELEEHIGCNNLEWDYGDYVDEEPSIEYVTEVDCVFTENEENFIYDFPFDREKGGVSIKDIEDYQQRKLLNNQNRLKKLEEMLNKLTINK